MAEEPFKVAGRTMRCSRPATRSRLEGFNGPSRVSRLLSGGRSASFELLAVTGCAMIHRDRQRGMLLGLAVGDALGAAVEFEVPGTFEPVTGYRGGGPHGLEPGEWTDDTSMALALAGSIADVGWDLNDQAERYLAWWRTGACSVNGRVFDIGTTTVAALQRFRQSGDAWTSGDRSEFASGNGSVMRLAPG